MTPSPAQSQPRCSRTPCQTSQAPPISATAARTNNRIERATMIADLRRPCRGIGASPASGRGSPTTRSSTRARTRDRHLPRTPYSESQPTGTDVNTAMRWRSNRMPHCRFSQFFENWALGTGPAHAGSTGILDQPRNTVLKRTDLRRRRSNGQQRLRSNDSGQPDQNVAAKAQGRVRGCVVVVMT